MRRVSRDNILCKWQISINVELTVLLLQATVQHSTSSLLLVWRVFGPELIPLVS